MKHRDTISKLTLEEKCYLLSGKDFWQTRSVKAKGVPNMTPSDGPHGIRKQEGAVDRLGLNVSLPATCFPTAATIANSWDPALGEEIGRGLGEEAASQDVRVLLGPGLNCAIRRTGLTRLNFIARSGVVSGQSSSKVMGMVLARSNAFNSSGVKANLFMNSLVESAALAIINTSVCALIQMKVSLQRLQILISILLMNGIPMLLITK